MSSIKSISAVLALVCATASALAAVPTAADAASRSFKIWNRTSHVFQFVGAEAVACSPGDGACKWLNPDGLYPMEFEGRPQDGEEMSPQEIHDFELKYTFNAGNPAGINFAADLVYVRFVRTDGGVRTEEGFRVRITTTNFSNTSACLSFDGLSTCTAGGGDITIGKPFDDDDPKPDLPRGQRDRDRKDKKAGKPKPKRQSPAK